MDTRKPRRTSRRTVANVFGRLRLATPGRVREIARADHWPRRRHRGSGARLSGVRWRWWRRSRPRLHGRAAGCWQRVRDVSRAGRFTSARRFGDRGATGLSPCCVHRFGRAEVGANEEELVNVVDGVPLQIAASVLRGGTRSSSHRRRGDAPSVRAFGAAAPVGKC